jgi:3-phosphoshikimate 1-carboxyvinyltransferase
MSGDKSISHRALILAAMSVGKTKIKNLLESEDIKSTVDVLKKLGVKIKKTSNYWEVIGNGTSGFIEPSKVLDCGNSGTTARLMIGAVASNPIQCTFSGDQSLSKRSMSRLTDYLEEIGTEVKLTNKHYLPLLISGSDELLPKSHTMRKASAQVKSALILAGLNIKGRVKIIENRPTRDHTEKLLKYLNVNFKIRRLANGGNEIDLNGPYEIKSKNIFVAGDPSSSSFFIVGALIVPGSNIKIKNVSLNPTRIAFIKILKKMGGKIKIEITGKRSGETVGNITARYSSLNGIEIKSNLAPFLIDEYPILSIAATQAKGKTIMRGLNELRHKESDRIKSIVYNLKKLNYNIKSKNDEIIIRGKVIALNKKYNIKTFNDHRIAMSFSILELLYRKKIIIDNAKCISISYPDFNKHLKHLICYSS